VTEVNAAPAIANVPGERDDPELAPYTFTATATDSDVPAQTLTFSLVGAPDGRDDQRPTGAFSGRRPRRRARATIRSRCA
jgi:hypothetical protein